MKPTLTLITLLIAVAVSGQTKAFKDTFDVRKHLLDTSYTHVGGLFATPSNKYFDDGKSILQFRDGSKTLLYSIKPDGTIELGDLIIDAVVKGLEKKGYRLIKVGGSATEIKPSPSIYDK